MGRRIHKVLGYGLQPFKPEKRFFEATRHNPPMWIWARTHVEEVLAAGADDVALRKLLKRNPGWCPSDSFVYDDENIRDLLVVVPPEDGKRWKRYDDDIDCIEALEARKSDDLNWRAPRAVDLSLDPEVKIPLRRYPRGQPPTSVRLLLAYIGLGHRVSELREMLYIYWS